VADPTPQQPGTNRADERGYLKDAGQKLEHHNDNSSEHGASCESGSDHCRSEVAFNARIEELRAVVQRFGNCTLASMGSLSLAHIPTPTHISFVLGAFQNSTHDTKPGLSGLPRTRGESPRCRQCGST
jgi:hypothetical protein